jgi:hypothetical protein
MSSELLTRTQSELEPVLDDPRDGDETEVVEKGEEGGETKRTQATISVIDPRDGDPTENTPQGPVPSISRNDPEAFDPREGDETETSQRDGGPQRQIPVSAEDPRDGDDTVPIRESPLTPPVRI